MFFLDFVLDVDRCYHGQSQNEVGTISRQLMCVSCAFINVTIILYTFLHEVTLNLYRLPRAIKKIHNKNRLIIHLSDQVYQYYRGMQVGRA